MSDHEPHGVGRRQILKAGALLAAALDEGLVASKLPEVEARAHEMLAAA